jgi:hypothetical protein
MICSRNSFISRANRISRCLYSFWDDFPDISRPALHFLSTHRKIHCTILIQLKCNRYKVAVVISRVNDDDASVTYIEHVWGNYQTRFWAFKSRNGLSCMEMCALTKYKGIWPPCITRSSQGTHNLWLHEATEHDARHTLHESQDFRTPSLSHHDHLDN